VQLISKCLATAANEVHFAVKWNNFFLCRMGEALCERPSALYRLKPEKHKQSVGVVRTNNKKSERGFGALSIGVLTKVFRSLLYAILLN